MVFELALLAKDQEDHNPFTTVDWQATLAGALCGQLGDKELTVLIHSDNLSAFLIDDESTVSVQIVKISG